MDRVFDPAEIDAVTDPRLRLVLAGAHVLASDGLAVLAAGVKPDEITRAAGRSRRVFYDHFETKEAFVRAVAETYLDTSGHALIAQATPSEVAELLQLAQGDLFDSMQRLASIGFARALASDADLIQVIALGLGHADTEIHGMVDEHYDAVDAATAAIIDGMLAHWGLAPRPPWTSKQLAVLIHAIGSGLYLRSRIQPEVATLELLELALVSLLPTVTAPIGSDTASVRESLERVAEDLSSSWRDSADQSRLDNAYERIIEAFRIELANRGLANVSVRSVSARSGLSAGLISRTFGGVVGLLRAAAFDSLPSLAEEAAFDLSAASLSIDAVLERHLLRVGTWIESAPGVARAIGAAAAIDPADDDGRTLAADVNAVLTGPVVTILESAWARGLAHPALPIADLATMTTELMLARCTRPGATVEEVGAAIGFVTSTTMAACRQPESADDAG